MRQVAAEPEDFGGRDEVQTHARSAAWQVRQVR